ncbi:MAG: hypothetical protein ACRD8O_09715, partial [Bryobacteraceae bacterium]
MKLLSAPNVAIAASLFVLNVALNAPLFEAGETRFRDSIEGGYASMARFVAAHPNPWGWNPTQYCGLPTQFTYVPGLPYLAALFIRLLPGAPPEHVYRVVAATLACLGPSTVFLALVVFTGSRWWSLAAAVAYTLFSPLYGLIPTVDRDRGGGVHLPWRLLVLVKYGEGPHNAGLTLIPLALAALWTAARNSRFAHVLVAAALVAAVALTNWVAALALAFCCAMLLLATLGTHALTGFRASRAFAAAGLAYGLACFWLTPSFIKTIAFNWPTDAFNYHLQQQERLLLAGLVVGVVAVRLLFQWLFPGEVWLCFLGLCFFGFAWVVEWFYSAGVAPIPESRRYALELEMFLILFVVEVFRRLWIRGTIVSRASATAAAAVMMAAGWNQVSGYARQGDTGRRPAPKEQTIEYRLAKRIADTQPRGRVFASGGLRFRLNSWFDISQFGGGFESGLRNRIPLHFAYQIRTGIGSKPARDGHDAADQLRALGVEYVVVHGPKSREHYRDYRNPAKFDGVLEVIHREEDDTIYRSPFTSLA